MALAAVLVVAGGVQASADELAVSAYASRLREARSLVAAARQQSGLAREASRRAGEELVRRTTAVRLPDGSTLGLTDAPIADRIARSDFDGALAAIDAAVESADIASREFSGEQADARLRELIQQQQVRSSGLTLFAIARAIADRLFGWAPRPDFSVLQPALAIIGVALTGVLVLLISRGTRERLRRETVIRGVHPARRAAPSDHLRRADEALRGGRARDAIHALYLYALAALLSRDALPDDPALTDRELLTLAAAVAHVEDLRELFGLHETIWFGLRDAAPADAARARSLAVRVAG